MMGRAEQWILDMCRREKVSIGVAFELDMEKKPPAVFVHVHATCRIHGYSRGHFPKARALEAALAGLTLKPCPRCAA